MILSTIAGLEGGEGSRLLFSELINPGEQFSVFRAHGRTHAPVTVPFELIQPGPMPRQVHRLEHLDIDCGAKRVQDQSRETKRRSPPGREQSAPHGPATPRTGQRSQLMMIRSAGG